MTLIQVCTDVSDPATYEREVRALSAAAAEYHGALPLLLTFDTLPPRSPLPKPLRWQPAIAWLLGDEGRETRDERRGMRRREPSDERAASR